jgi:hypothetical protein
VLKASKKVLNFPQDLAGPLPNKCSRKQGWRSRPIVLQRRHLRVSSSALLNCKESFLSRNFYLRLVSGDSQGCHTKQWNPERQLLGCQLWTQTCH